MLTAGLVLAIMVIPFISSVMREVFLTVPNRLKESAYALGSTTWEVVWDVVLPYTRSAVIGGIFLGLGPRAGRDHGGHLRDRQRLQHLGLAARAGHLHRLDHRQRIRRGGRSAAQVDAARARLPAVRADLRRAGDRQADADAAASARRAADGRRRAPVPAPQPQEQAGDAAGRRRGDLRPVLADLDPVDDGQQGRGQPRPRPVHDDDAAAGRARRPAQRVLRQRGDQPAGDRASARRSASPPAPSSPSTPTTPGSAR